MLRSIMIVTASLCITALVCAAIVIINLFSAAGKLSRRIACLWAKCLLYISGVKIEVIGGENIPAGKAQIFMANHQSDFDILVCLAGIPADFLWTAKKELFKIPVFGNAMRKSGYIEIDRQDHSKALINLAEAAEKLKAGLSIATFPEGTRSKNGKMLPFKQGMFYLAIQTGVPIVPVSIIGSGNIMPKKSLQINRGKIIMVIDEPVDVSTYTIETRAALIEKVQGVIRGHLGY